jgi:dihydrolipoamide dehydrogenase
MKFHLSTKVVGGQTGSDGVKLKLEPANAEAKNVPETIDAEYVLVSVGRRPYTEGLNLSSLGVGLDKLGRIEVNDHLQTLAHSHIYAIGDCVRGPQLAHKAEEEGIYVAEQLGGKGGHINYEAMPWVIYTHPELAFVGKTEEQLKAENIAYNKGVFPMMANSRARANHDTEGMVKVLADKKTDKVLGVHILGSVAGEMIMEAVLGMEYGAASEDLARTCHAHPGYSEALKEACLATFSKPIHF